MATQQGIEAFFEIQVPEEDVIQNKLTMGHTYSLLNIYCLKPIECQEIRRNDYVTVMKYIFL